jgi:probable HAF family extracellular repeat protein
MIGTYSDRNLSPATPGPQHGFLYSGGIYTVLDFPGATATQPSGINASGQITGFYGDSSGVTHGFVYIKGIYTTIDPPDRLMGTGAIAGAINDLGQIVGYYQGSNGTVYGFLATDPRLAKTPQ